MLIKRPLAVTVGHCSTAPRPNIAFCTSLAPSSLSTIGHLHLRSADRPILAATLVESQTDVPSFLALAPAGQGRLAHHSRATNRSRPARQKKMQHHPLSIPRKKNCRHQPEHHTRDFRHGCCRSLDNMHARRSRRPRTGFRRLRGRRVFSTAQLPSAGALSAQRGA